MVISDLFAELEFKVLRQDLAVSKKSGYAVGTANNLRIQWKSFLLFCFYFKLTPVPVTTDTLSLYAQFLSRTFASTDSIRNYVSGVRTMICYWGWI